MVQVKLTRNQILSFERNDVSARETMKSTLLQAQELLNIKETEIASDNAFDPNIKKVEDLLSNLRNITHDIATAPMNKEQIFKIGLIDNEIITRINEQNVKLLSLSQDIYNSIKSDKDFTAIKERMTEFRDTFLERQKLFSTSKMI